MDSDAGALGNTGVLRVSGRPGLHAVRSNYMESSPQDLSSLPVADWPGKLPSPSPAGALPGEWENVDTQTATLPVIDLNQLYEIKCHGAAPWRGSILCNLGEGGALGQLVASLRLIRGSNGYSNSGLVAQVLLGFRGLEQLLTMSPTDPWYTRLGLGVIRRVPATQAFLRVYSRVSHAVENNELVQWSDFDELTAYAVSLLEVPVIRNALRVYLTDSLNATLLDLGAEARVENRGWPDQVMGWIFNRVPGLMDQPEEFQYEDAMESDPDSPDSLPLQAEAGYFEAPEYPDDPSLVGLDDWQNM